MAAANGLRENPRLGNQQVVSSSCGEINGRGFREHQVHSAQHHHRDEFPGWNKAPSFFAQFIDDRTRNVLEVGCGPNPTLPLSMLAGKDLRYVVSDLFVEELEKAPPGYDRRVLDLENPTMPEDLLGRFDLIISRMVNEHISDGERYHRNILSLLRHGGRTVHCSASLFTAPLLANKAYPGCGRGRSCWTSLHRATATSTTGSPHIAVGAAVPRKQ